MFDWVNKINPIAKLRAKILNKTAIYIDYPPIQVPRYGYGKQPHMLLYNILNSNREKYIKTLQSFLRYKEKYLAIPVSYDRSDPLGPYLNIANWLPVLDSLSLYALLAIYKPEKYIEVGSGNSTKFARRSIIDNQLNTRIISIDPQPRAEINDICDEIIRKPVEDLDVNFFAQLNPSDILFIDNSHRCFMNSDVTAIFLDVVPRLKPGVVVEFHDIFLPNDYPPHFDKRYYSEQYLLAAYLLAETRKFEILLPNNFISSDDELQSELNPIYEDERFTADSRAGASFWIVMK